jgi:hypothetical protein
LQVRHGVFSLSRAVGIHLRSIGNGCGKSVFNAAQPAGGLEVWSLVVGRWSLVASLPKPRRTGESCDIARTAHLIRASSFPARHGLALDS